MINNRERFLKTMRFEAVDHPPLLVPGPWATTRRRWEREGLPAGVSLEEYFGVESFSMKPIGIDTLLFPPFEEKVLSETGDYVIKINAKGAKVRNVKDETSMPEFLEYAIKGPEDLTWLRERLNPDSPGRTKPSWLAEAKARQDAGAVMFCNGGMYFSFLNEYMGTERTMYTYFDHPEFVHQVNDMLCTLCERALRTALPSFQLDDVGYHEDMAYRNGSIISPVMFREFMTPYYKRITGITDRHGIDLHVMDSDGDIRELIPLWLECGINCFLPLEVAAGMDVVKLRAQYGRDIAMIGGFDKRILAQGKQEIRQELERIRPVIEGGGYIPNCDHGVPHDVPFENVCFFVEYLKSTYGMR